MGGSESSQSQQPVHGGAFGQKRFESSASAPSDPLRSKRILAEAKRCSTLTLQNDGVCIDASSALPDRPWTAYIQGPLATIWESSVFQVAIYFPDKYPWQPLQIRFEHSIFHPNVASDGCICNRLAGDHWSPALGPGAMLTYTRALLDVPNFATKDLGIVENEEVALEADKKARNSFGRSNTPQLLFHYTSRDAYAAISSSKRLNESQTGLAGPGIYATTMHPTNCTREHIERNNWGTSRGARTEFVIQLDVGALQEQGFAIEKVDHSRDVWLIRRILGGACSLPLTDSNSVISDFEHMSSCEWNKEAGRLFREKQAEYQQRVMETIGAFGQQIPDVKRQAT